MTTIHRLLNAIMKTASELLYNSDIHKQPLTYENTNVIILFDTVNRLKDAINESIDDTSKIDRSRIKFVTHDTCSDLDGLFDEFDGTSLLGEIEVTYNQLVQVFGKGSTNFIDDYKSDIGWLIKFEDGTIADVYNWKDGYNYNGQDGLPVQQITDWHIGGKDPKALENVKIALGLKIPESV